jgi:hypothetical protein
MAMEREYPEGPYPTAECQTSTSPHDLSGYQTPPRVLGEPSQQNPYYHRGDSAAAVGSIPAGSLGEPTRQQVHQVLRQPSQLEPSYRHVGSNAAVRMRDGPTRLSGPSQLEHPQAQPQADGFFTAESFPASPLGLGAAFASQFLQQRCPQPAPSNQETPELQDVATSQSHGYHVGANAHMVPRALKGRCAGAHSEAGVHSGLPHPRAPDAPQLRARQLVERTPEKVSMRAGQNASGLDWPFSLAEP